MIWEGSKKGVFSIRSSLYLALEQGGEKSLFLPKLGFRLRCASLLRRHPGEGFDIRSAEEKGSVFGKQVCLLCLEEEETLDHILLHCVTVQVLWHPLFSLFEVTWGKRLSSVRSLLSRGLLWGRRGTRLGKLLLFWTMWKERNSRVFHYKGHTIQRLKQFFLFNLWGWVNMFIETVSFVDFVD